MKIVIEKIDIKNVAISINVELTDSEIEWVLTSYADAQRQDPSGTWNLVVEDLVHQCVNMRDDSTNLIIKITGGGTRKDISKALKLISKSILITPIEDIDGSEWEDCTLMTEINVEK